MGAVEPTHDPSAATLDGSVSGASATTPHAPRRETSGDPTLDGEDQTRVGGSHRGLDVGTRVGRFVVTGRLGAGGMGVVYGAYDPELERRVALKLLQDDVAGDGTRRSEGRTRLLREAQALAKLSHPEIVAVHDVGEYDGAVWLAMEYVDGETLGEWRRRPRSWREVVEVMTAVGRGVAAAHAAGLVHRDLKPDNVMVGRDGRVRVMDFGLTRSHGAGAGKPSSRPLPPSLLASIDDRTTVDALTRVGAVLGTPAYMSPEQFSGLEVGPASDQWSYCVTFWELLYGVRPYAGRNVAQLATSILDGRRTPPPSGRRVPRWLTRVLDRGLAVDPERRWPSMQALLDELRLATRRRWLAAGGFGVLTASAIGGAFLAMQHAADLAVVEACDAEAALIDDTWNDTSRARIVTAFGATGVVGAEDTAERVTRWLDAWTGSWKDVQRDACLAHRRRGSMDAREYDKATWCLEARRLEFVSLVDDLLEAVPATVHDSIASAAGLQPLATCEDPTFLALQAEPPPADVREDMRALWAGLGEVRSRASRGRYEEALERLERLEKAELAKGWPARDALLGLVRAGTESNLGRHEASERTAVQAYFAAAGANEFGLAADAANHLVFTVGYDLGRPREAETWAEHASLAIVRGGDVLALREAERVSALASSHVAAGQYEAALVLAMRASKIREDALGPNHPSVATSLNNVANALDMLGRYEEAIEVYERALRIRTEVQGPDHPTVAVSLYNLANALEENGERSRAQETYQRALELGTRLLGPNHVDVADTMNAYANLLAGGDADEVEQARVMYRDAIAIMENVLGPTSPDLSRPLSNLAGIESDAGRNVEALALVERALTLQVAAFGAEHPDLASTHSVRGRIHHALGDLEMSLDDYQRALDLRLAALGEEHPMTAAAMDNVAMLLIELDRPERALEVARRSLAVSEKTLGDSHPDLYYALDHIATAAMEASPDEALAAATRSVELLANAEVSDSLRGAAAFTLAKAILAAERDRTRALATAREARALIATDPEDVESLRDVDEWIRSSSR